MYVKGATPRRANGWLAGWLRENERARAGAPRRQACGGNNLTGPPHAAAASTQDIVDCS